MKEEEIFGTDITMNKVAIMDEGDSGEHLRMNGREEGGR